MYEEGKHYSLREVWYSKNDSDKPEWFAFPIKEESHNNPLPHDVQKWIENNAGELIKKFGNKKLALIYVGGIIDFMMSYDERHNSCLWVNSSEMRYWCEVKQFISKSIKEESQDELWREVVMEINDAFPLSESTCEEIVKDLQVKFHITRIGMVFIGGVTFSIRQNGKVSWNSEPYFFVKLSKAK